MNPNESKSLASLHDQPGDNPGLSTFTEDDGAYGDASLDPLAGAVSMKKSHTGTILIAAVILIAVAGVVSMRKLAQVTAATGIDREIEQTIEQFIGSLTPDGTRVPKDPTAPVRVSDDILSVLGTAYTEIQVPLNDVQRDPFIITEIDEAKVDTRTITPEEIKRTQKDRLAELRDTRREELLDAGDNFVLKAIMGGSNPLANVNGSNLTVGATILSESGEEFTVKSIGTTTVELTAGDAALGVEVTKTLLLDRSR